MFLCLFLYLLGYKHVQRTFQINDNDGKGAIKVLSANVRIFNVYKHLRNQNSQSSKDMIKWIRNNDADILILQEYYNKKNSEIWSSTSQISEKYPYKYFEVSLHNRLDADFGQIIFSKYPITDKGLIPYDNRTFNQAIFADVKIDDDTIRVYNIHLQSMAIEERKLFDNKNDKEHIKQKIKDTIHKLGRGSRLRSNQIKKITEHIKDSPFPVILGADMNDTPYSYAYNEFSKLLDNSFEKRGNGFGFTFNGKLFFLRIDNLFSSSDIIPISHTVHREIPHSDHYPVSATYNLL